MSTLSSLIATRDMKKAIEFYRDLLGVKMGIAFLDINNSEYADLSKDGMVLRFVPAENIGIGSEERPGISINLYMEIDGDIDEYYQRVTNKGVRIAADIKKESGE